MAVVRDTKAPEGYSAVTYDQVVKNPEIAQTYGAITQDNKRYEQTREDQIASEQRFLDFTNQQNERQMQWQKDQAAAAKLAQDTAQYQSMQQAAQQSALQSQQQAAQQMGLQNQYQQMQDANAVAQQKQQAAAAGTAATGGGFDINTAQNAQATALGMRTGSIPTTAANQPAGAPKMTNQVGGSGQAGFKMPQTSGIKFGGL